jgi:D-arabinitol dehydrogenase (NADP+)
LIKVMACGICGTDIHILRGEYIGNYPITPGHEFSGIIDEIGPEVTRLKAGDRIAVEPNISCDNCFNCLNNHQNFCEKWQALGVTLQGGMAHYVIAPGKAVFDIGDLPFESGAFVEPLSCVLHGIEKVKINISDRVLILGAGPIGLLFLQMTRLQGAAYISVLDRQTSRLAAAVKFGADQTAKNIKDLKENDFDVVIDATGVIALMGQTINYVRPGGKVLLFGVPPSGEKICFEAFKIFQKGITLLSSFTSVRNTFQAISLLQSGQINVSELISHRLPLTEFSRGVELIEKGMDNVKKVIILPQE